MGVTQAITAVLTVIVALTLAALVGGVVLMAALYVLSQHIPAVPALGWVESSIVLFAIKWVIHRAEVDIKR